MAKDIKLLVTRRFPPDVLTRAERDYSCTFNDADTAWQGEELTGRAAGHDGMLCSSSNKFSAEVIEGLPQSIRILSTFSVGYEHIDLDAARARGIAVTNTPGVLSEATADLAFMLLLCASRRAGEADRLVRAGLWRGWAPTQLLGAGLQGKRLGILGMGGIGRALAQRGRAFGLEIHYHNRSRLAPDRELGAVYHETADALLEVSDFLSLNCPMSDDMKHFLNAQRIARMPDGAVVVNTARGGLIDDVALIGALQSGKLMAAGLDVYEGEPDMHPGYRELGNVFLTPHLGSATVETRNAMGFKALDNLDAFFAGTEPPDRLV
ncbi:MAG: D-glycerate dehydrogenase [Magnetovibrio sp.]|nr:D-glycerate dehydrogenase [Magnetovibrio sp.]